MNISLQRVFPLTIFILMSCFGYAQFDYTASTDFPYGRPHPDTPEQFRQYAPMIGICDCESVNRKPDNSWGDPVAMTWTFRYIMNGNAVQDQTLKANGAHSGSIRQFNTDSLKWYVHYYSSSSASSNLRSWKGGMKEGNIVLYSPQQAPNGKDGYYRLTFYDISEAGFNWVGEWVDLEEKIVFPTWKISCRKREE